MLHMSWQFVALSRVFQHTEAKSVIKWGVMECLQMNLRQSPLLLRKNWKVCRTSSYLIPSLMLMYIRAYILTTVRVKAATSSSRCLYALWQVNIFLMLVDFFVFSNNYILNFVFIGSHV